MGHLQSSYLIPASRERVYEYILNLDQLIQDLAPAVEISFALVHSSNDDAGGMTRSVNDSGRNEENEEQRDGQIAERAVPADRTLPLVRAHAEIPMALQRFGITAHGMIRVERAVQPSEVVYNQEAGWFKSWRHSIQLKEHSDGSTPMTLVSDLIDYRLPMGILGTLTDDLFLKRDLQRTLRERAARMVNYFEARPAPASDQAKSSSANPVQPHGASIV